MIPFGAIVGALSITPFTVRNASVSDTCPYAFRPGLFIGIQLVIGIQLAIPVIPISKYREHGMHNSSRFHEQPQQSSEDPQQWVIWNGFFGVLDTVVIGEMQTVEGVRHAWLEEPYDMVGPFSLDELEACGKISFAACVVMSRELWQRDQVELRREAHAARRAAQEKLNAEQERLNRRRQQRVHPFEVFNEKKYRQSLDLPEQGELKVAQIKAAYRKLAQKAHPDLGGSQEQFVKITEARDALLKRIA